MPIAILVDIAVVFPGFTTNILKPHGACTVEYETTLN